MFDKKKLGCSKIEYRSLFGFWHWKEANEQKCKIIWSKYIPTRTLPLWLSEEWFKNFYLRENRWKTICRLKPLTNSLFSDLVTIDDIWVYCMKQKKNRISGSTEIHRSLRNSKWKIWLWKYWPLFFSETWRAFFIFTFCLRKQ